MYHVLFSSPSALEDIVKVFTHGAIEPCLEFALALHRSSNIPHVISVFRDEETCLVTLTREENPTEKR